MGSLNKMNFITRLSALCLRKSKMQQRHQSSRRPAVPLGSRILTDPSKVYEHNMWDHMQWSREEEENAKERAAENSLVKVQWEERDKYEREASKYWNEFYKTHKNKFFKDRNWLFLEFPEILPEKKREKLKTEERSSECTKINSTNSFSHKNEIFEEGEKYWKKNYGGGSTSVQGYVCNKKEAKSPTDNPQGKNCGEELGRLESFPGSDATYRILEVGCGAGNSVFPILKVLCNTPGTFLYCCDFASGAVELMRSWMSFSLSLCSLLFILTEFCQIPLLRYYSDSSFHPQPLGVEILILMQGVVNRLAKLLKPGGMLLFRDYGRYDTAQLRFKKGHCLSENFYVRGDGTRVYFFTKDEVWNMFNLAGLTEVQNLVDRRLQVNRKKKVKMQRVWIQSKFQKPLLLSLNIPEETTKRHP
ncbi:tRNA N(3)-cytidine methyltransferase METTL8, mitochondrial isoform X2 [Balearica regulorum gibbericeps]|uniref:tRNA N(3)-cytidine methyltransferase METTL8, mitochondrial isoform X2 n=1 Tax=Balearica regulorum gibbericeps TaxID=100784 RepID=UPI003F606F6D